MPLSCPALISSLGLQQFLPDSLHCSTLSACFWGTPPFRVVDQLPLAEQRLALAFAFLLYTVHFAAVYWIDSLSHFTGELPSGWADCLPKFGPEDKGLATRLHSQTMLNALAGVLPGFLGGSADLAPSNMTLMKAYGDFQKGQYQVQPDLLTSSLPMDICYILLCTRLNAD